jgi:hypothetical protein
VRAQELRPGRRLGAGCSGASKPVLIVFLWLFFHLCNSFVVSFSTSAIVLFV